MKLQILRPENPRQTLLIDFLAVLACGYLLTLNIAEFPVRIWDESIYANNALELWKEGHFLIMYNNGIPNFFNIKPPLVVGLQGLSMSLFGINPLALRLPSILASIGLFCSMLYFVRRWTGNSWSGRWAILALALSPGYMREHVARTGDLDAMLVLFSFLLVASTMAIVTGKGNRDKLILAAMAALFLGFLTKSTAIFLCLPACGSLLLSSRESRKVFINPQFIRAGLVCVSLIASYLVLKSQLQEVFLSKFMRVDVSRALSSIMSWHQQPWSFYLENLWNQRLHNVFLYFLPVGLYLGFRSRDEAVRRLISLSLFFIIIYEITIAIPPDKLDWYEAPVYPFLSIVTGLGLVEAGKWLYSKGWIWLASGLVLFTACIVLLYMNQSKSLKSKSMDIHPLEEEGAFLHHLQEYEEVPKDIKILMEVKTAAHYHQVNFYRKKILMEAGKSTDLFPFVYQLKPGDTVLACQQIKKDSLGSTFEVIPITEWKNCMLCRIE